jgi:hypothetical protein
VTIPYADDSACGLNCTSRQLGWESPTYSY